MKMQQTTISNSSDLIFSKENGSFICCYRQYLTDEMQDFLRHPDIWLDSSKERFFKSASGNDTTTVGVVVVDKKKFVVKRYNIKSWRHFLKKCWRQSNAMKTWNNVHYLRTKDIDTLIPVAVIEKRYGRYGLLRGKAYFISEYEDGVRGCDYFGAGVQPTAEWRKVIENIAIMISRMRASCIEHQDFQYGNLLIIGKKPLLLDLDHMKVYARNNDRNLQCAWKCDIDHFLKFLQPNPLALQMFRTAFEKFN